MKVVLRNAAQSAVHALLRPVEERLLAKHEATRHPPCFVVGPPRSGTSLFYELLVTRYRFAYFSNLAHRFYRTPAAATQLGRRLISRRKPSFSSDYGHIEGWGAPNEGGWIWRRWLTDGDWVDERALAGLPAAEMRATLGAMEGIIGAPFVNKNVMHSNRMRLLAAVFPGCVFIEVLRDPAATVRSIVRAERAKRGPTRHSDDWWSVRPSGVATGDVIERAVRQVLGVTADIARDGASLGSDRLLSVKYEDLCNRPEESLGDVSLFLERHGWRVAPNMQIPGAFRPSPPPPLDPAEEARVRSLLDAGTT